MRPAERDDKVLRTVVDLWAERGYPPAVREIADRLELRSVQQVHASLVRLKQQGRLTWNPKQPRTLRVLTTAE